MARLRTPIEKNHFGGVMFHDQRHHGDLASGSKDLAGTATMCRFTLTEAEIEDGCREIRVEGELDLAVSDQLREAIVGCPSDQILISLQSCQFIDSSGIAIIVRAHCADGSRVVVHSPSNQVLRILEMTGLTASGVVFADREQALAAVVGPVSS
jgi:anti-sigma B factor antagonist